MTGMRGHVIERGCSPGAGCMRACGCLRLEQQREPTSGYGHLREPTRRAREQGPRPRTEARERVTRRCRPVLEADYAATADYCLVDEVIQQGGGAMENLSGARVRS